MAQPVTYYSTPCQDLSTPFGEWLSRWDWDWWCTFTFRKDYTPRNAKKAWKRFTRYLTKGLYYFTAYEWHKDRVAVHIHALVGGVGGLRRLTVMDFWLLKNGFCKIVPYDPKRGARHYLSKYLTKGLADWDFRLPLDKQLKMCYGVTEVSICQL